MSSGNSGTKLETMFAYQAHLVKAIGTERVFGARRDPSSPEFLHLAFELIREVTEMVESTLDENKPWKAAKGKEAIEQEAFEELVDCLFYILELFLFIDKGPDEVFDAYMDKWRRNMRRLQSGPGTN